MKEYNENYLQKLEESKKKEKEKVIIINKDPFDYSAPYI